MTREGKPTTVLDPPAARVIRALADETPAARIQRVRGVLDMLTVSTKTMALRLDDGRLLRGFAGAVALDRLKQLLGAEVVLEGSITFRPSGEALRIEVESAMAATPGDIIWAQLPRVEAASSRARLALVPTGLDAFFGRWPGDESDEQLVAALRDVL